MSELNPVLHFPEYNKPSKKQPKQTKNTRKIYTTDQKDVIERRTNSLRIALRQLYPEEFDDDAAVGQSIRAAEINDFPYLNTQLLALVLRFLYINYDVKTIKDLNYENFNNEIIFGENYFMKINIVDSGIIEETVKHKADFLRYLILVMNTK
jgi:hypothetical protein